MYLASTLVYINLVIDQDSEPLRNGPYLLEHLRGFLLLRLVAPLERRHFLVALLDLFL